MNRWKLASIMVLAIGVALVTSMHQPRLAAQVESPEDGASLRGAGLFSASGRLRFLRVNDVGGSFGPCPNCITAEVVFNFVSSNNWYGLRLLNDANLPAHQAAVDLLRDAFNNNWTVQVDYSDDGLANRTNFPVGFGRVTISRP